MKKRTMTKQKKQITQKEAKSKYGIVISKMQKLDKVKFYLLPNGNVVDSLGDIRYRNDDRPRCDNCGKLATRNIQECIVEWSINRNGDYSKNPVDYREIGGDNIHLCDDCEE